MTDIVINTSAAFASAIVGLQGPAGPSVSAFTAGTNFAVGQAFRASGSQAVVAVTRLRHLPFAGICIQAGTAGAKLNFLVRGPVDPSIFNLGAGVACAAGTDASGNVVRATDTSCVSHGNWVGYVGTDGAVTIGPFQRDKYYLIDYGALADNVHDDTPAWDAASNAVPLGTVAEFQLPLGLIFCAGHTTSGGPERKLSWKRTIRLICTAGGNSESPQSGIRLPPLTRIEFDDSNTSGDTGDSRHSRLEYCDILQKTPICSTSGNSGNYGTLGAGVDIRVSGQYVEVGTWVLYSGATASGTPTAPGAGPVVAFLCIAAGTPTGAEPAAFATSTLASLGATIVDTGGVQWLVVSVPKDWQASHVTVVGQIACIPGDPRFFYKCVALTGDAKTGSSMPAAFAQPQILATIQDNNVTWQPIPAGSIFLHSESVKISHCIFRGGYGNGVLIESGYFGPGSTNYAFADLCEVSDCDFFYTGGGVMNHGADANGSHFSRCKFFGMSLPQRSDTGFETGVGEICVWNRSQGPCFFHDNASQFTHSPAYVNDAAASATPGRLGKGSGSGSTWDGISSENGLPSCFYGSGCHVVGTSTAGVSADSTAVIYDGVGYRNLRMVDTSGAIGLTLALGLQNGLSTLAVKGADEAQFTGLFSRVDGMTSQGWNNGTSSHAHDWYGIFYNDNGFFGIDVFPGPNATWPDGTACPPGSGMRWCMNGIAMGTSTQDPVMMIRGSAPPSSGYFGKGSICVNENPTNTIWGWQNKVTGTSGRWVAVGQGDLAISPSSVSLNAGDTQTFTASAGSLAGYTFSIVSDPSLGSINASTGHYVPGLIAGTADVRASDNGHGTADASVTVTVPANLIFWVRADRNVTQDVSSPFGVNAWGDLSTGSHNGTQTTTSRKPTLVASDVDGHPAISFAGASAQNVAFGNFTGGLSAMTIFCVFRATSGNIGSNSLFSKAFGSTEWELTGAGAGKLYFQVGAVGGGKAVSNAALDDGNWHVIVCTHDSTANPSTKMYVDGTVQSTTGLNQVAIPAGTDQVAFGGYVSTTGSTAANITAEVEEGGIFGAILNSTDITHVTNYLLNSRVSGP